MLKVIKTQLAMKAEMWVRSHSWRCEDEQQRKGSGRMWCMSARTSERPWDREARRLKKVRGRNLTCRSQGMLFRKKVVKYNRGNEEREISPIPSIGILGLLEEGMVTHSSILAWTIPWTEEPDGQQSIGSHKVGHN